MPLEPAHRAPASPRLAAFDNHPRSSPAEPTILDSTPPPTPFCNACRPLATPASLRINMLRSDALDYDLPPHLIAAYPCPQRDASRMMVLDRSGRILAHRYARDLPEYFGPGDAMILNDSRVIPARFTARRLDTGGRIEGLYLASRSEPRQADALLRPGSRVRLATPYVIESPSGDLEDSRLTVLGREKDHWLIRLDGPLSWSEALGRAGHAPLPPYILSRRREAGDASLDTPEDRARYQTVYAGPEGAVAAPTAGLHFTEDLLAECRRRGVDLGFLTLHVGAGTFKPVETEFVEQHPIHEEWFTVSAATLELLRRTRNRGGRLIAVGTTSVRALESLPDPPPDQTLTAATRLLITPGFRFRRVDGLLTNFHLPRSSLMALVAAVIGVEPLLAAYREAIAREYRFYSYGDCMLILP